MAKRECVVVESCWCNEDFPITTTWGPYTLEEAKEMFLFRLMVNQGIDPDKDTEERAKVRRKYAHTFRYHDKEDHWMTCIQTMQR